MPTILDLFKEQKKDLYGKSENIRIESRGLINPPRGAALLLSSPNSFGDFIGNQVAGAFRGSANRPSDTIFKGNSLLSKPISLFKTPGQLRNAIEPGTDYVIKQQPPSPNSVIGTIKQGTSSPLGTIANLGLNAIKGLKDKNPSRGLPYGQKYQTTISGKSLTETKTFSNHFTEYNDLSKSENKDPKLKTIGTLKKREGGQLISWDTANNFILGTEYLTQEDLVIKQTQYKFQNQIWVTFKKYGNSEIVPFVGTVGAISEDITPEWTNFRYLGSPFKSYRYLGVERTLNFELKLYYNTTEEKDVMIKKINYLKSLAFPYEQISEITYKKDTVTQGINDPVLMGTGEPKQTNQSTQYAFSPNLVEISIGDMYKNLFGLIETISLSIDEDTTWPNSNYNMTENGNNELYPSVVTIGFGMKIIEKHGVERGTVTKYKYDFDGKGVAPIQASPPNGLTKPSNQSVQSDMEKWTKARALPKF